MKAYLGIDTSCYTSSCALVDAHLRILASKRTLLPVKAGARGLQQSEAVFEHIRQLPALLTELSEEWGLEIQAVCASEKPVDTKDSYMPVFLVGAGIARSIAAAMNIPCFLSTHQRGHLEAARLGNTALGDQYLALHLSGGTTELLQIQGEGISCLLSGLDLHVGQLIDRVGVKLGLGFPAGPALEQLAQRGQGRGRYPAIVSEGGCHLSGVETQAMRDIEAGEMSRQDIAHEVFDAVSRTVVKMLASASETSGLKQALLFGGVASSHLLRDLLLNRMQTGKHQIELYFSRPELSGDNAVGAALIAAQRHQSP